MKFMSFLLIVFLPALALGEIQCGNNVVDWCFIVQSPSNLTIRPSQNTNFAWWGSQSSASLIELPVITMNTGDTIRLGVNPSSSSSHPFYLTASESGGDFSNAIKTGVSPSNTNSYVSTGISPGEFLTFRPTISQNIFYQCTVHTNMGWRLNVESGTPTLSPTSTSPSASPTPPSSTPPTPLSSSAPTPPSYISISSKSFVNLSFLVATALLSLFFF